MKHSIISLRAVGKKIGLERKLGSGNLAGMFGKEKDRKQEWEGGEIKYPHTLRLNLEKRVARHTSEQKYRRRRKREFRAESPGNRGNKVK